MALGTIRIRHGRRDEIDEIRALYDAEGDDFVRQRPIDELQNAIDNFSFFLADDPASGEIYAVGVAFNRSDIEGTEDRRWEFGGDLVVNAARGLGLQQVLVWFRLLHVHLWDDWDDGVGEGGQAFFAVIAQLNGGSRTTYERCHFVPLEEGREQMAGKPVSASKDLYIHTGHSLPAAARELLEIRDSGEFVRRNKDQGVKSKVGVELPATFDSLWPVIEELAAR